MGVISLFAAVRTAALVFMLVVVFAPLSDIRAEPTIGEIMNAVVEVHADIKPNARTVDSLGPSRTGSGVLIGDDGLIVTIGYIIMEADRLRVRTRAGTAVPADFVAYDHETGFGLLRARQPIGATPLVLGNSDTLKKGARLLVVSVGQSMPVSPVEVVSRRLFAGYWEYLLDRAIYTMPPHREYGGAALVNQSGQLVGIGSLLINDAPGPRQQGHGNMFVPVAVLKPVLDSLISSGRVGHTARPWLGVYTEELRGQLVITRLAKEGPGENAGLHPGEVVLGVNGDRVKGMADFFRKVRSQGSAGAEVSLDILTYSKTDMSVRKVAVKSRDRHGWLRLAK
jgi:S1-C subfamily serine protease